MRRRPKSIGKADFVSTCKLQLGDGPRSVVIKLMKEKEQWERERDARAENNFNSNFVVLTLNDMPAPFEIAAAVLARGGGLGAIAKQYLPEGISLGVHAIIMDAADRNLQQIFLQERPDLNGVRAILQQIFEAVAHLHAEGLMHGDLKLLNVVRFRRDNRLRLIDFDAAAKIAPVGGECESCAGAKFSSAVLPPEMFHALKQGEAEALEAYWQGESKELQAKVAPKPFRQRGIVKSSYAIKSFLTEGGKPLADGLPYSNELVTASANVDAWALGALAFALLTGETLIPATRDDDCASGAAMHIVYSWGTQPDVIVELFKKIHDEAARDVVRQLLQYDPKKRPAIAALLENHPFFHPDRIRDNDPEMVASLRDLREKLDSLDTILAEEARLRQDDRVLLERIFELGVANKKELRRTCDVLLKGIFEASEVLTPTTFIVVLKKLPVPPNEEEKAKLLKIAADGSGVTLGNDNFSLTFTGDSAGVGGKYVDTLNTGMKWLCRLKTIGSKVATGKVGEPFDTIKAGLDDLVTDEPMFLYLVDDLTGEPVRAEGWPIEIKKPSDVVPKLLPVMQVGLRAMSVFNGAAGVARMFGYPVPLVPGAWAAGARESVALLKQKSSVEQFSVVHEEVVKDRDAKAITDTSKEQKSVRGRSLRDFTDFLKEHDPGLKVNKSGHFAGLRRIADEDGTALWTVLTDSSAVKAAIEARAKERREEERRGDELLQQALELSSAPAAAAAAGASSVGHQVAHAVVPAGAATSPAAAATTTATELSRSMPGAAAADAPTRVAPSPASVPSPHDEEPPKQQPDVHVHLAVCNCVLQ